MEGQEQKHSVHLCLDDFLKQRMRALSTVVGSILRTYVKEYQEKKECDPFDLHEDLSVVDTITLLCERTAEFDAFCISVLMPYVKKVVPGISDRLYAALAVGVLKKCSVNLVRVYLKEE